MTQSQADDLLRHAVDANLAYYDAVRRLTADYVQALAAVVRESLPRREAPRPPAPPPAAAPRPPAPTLLLEGTDDAPALGAFVVENELARTIEASVVASRFVAADGREVQPGIRFDPATVALERGGQAVVHAIVEMDDSLAPGVEYRGEFAVPGLPATSIPVAIRRRETPPAALTA